MTTHLTQFALVSAGVILGILLATGYWLSSRLPEAAHDLVREYHYVDERLTAYRELMMQIIAINRICVGLSSRHFEDQMERLAFENESKLDEPYEELTATYQSYFYILDPDVRAAISDYLDYMKTYHDDGATVGRLLSKSGNVVQAMRDDLGLATIFPDGEPHPGD